MSDKEFRLETQTIHAGRSGREAHGSLVPPIYQSATFTFESIEQGSQRFANQVPGYIYTRKSNPTINELEKRMAILENTEAAAAFASGMGAVSAALIANLKSGDHIITSPSLYGCTYTLIHDLLEKFGVTCSHVDLNNKTAVEAAITSDTKLIYIETPVNPLLDVVDLTRIATLAKKFDLLTICDNTFMSPVLQQPSRHGIDIVVHSATKYLNGHGDILAGIVCASQEQIDHIRSTVMNDIGAIISPNDAWLLMRGLKTLCLRVVRHCQNAEKIAGFLNSHAAVRAVYYPGLPDHPAKLLLNDQMRHGGGIVCFEIEGDAKQSKAFMNALKLCAIAVSLGDPETLVSHPASMSHSIVPAAERERMGISDGLIRIAVGLEHHQDIMDDLDQALMASVVA